MGQAIAKLVKHDARVERDAKRAEQRSRVVSSAEVGALQKLRSEARSKGTVLANGGKGGLPSSLVLNVMRRDDYQCKMCGTRHNVSVHHKGGIVESRWLSRKGHSNVPNNLVSMCLKCHDIVHQKAKAAGTDSSQVTPEGDR